MTVRLDRPDPTGPCSTAARVHRERGMWGPRLHLPHHAETMASV